MTNPTPRTPRGELVAALEKIPTGADQRERTELELQNRDLREALHKLEESRARYLELYDAAPVAYLTLNRAAVVEQANLLAASLFDVDRADLIGRPLIVLLAPEARSCFLSHVRRCLEGQSVVDEITTPAGVTGRVLQLTSRPARDADGVVVAARTVVTDVTALRRAEEKLRWLCDAGDVLSRCVDEESTLQEVAQRAVPAVADACAFDVTTDDGARYVAAAAVDDLARHALFEHPPESATLRVPLVAEKHIVGELGLLMTDSGRMFLPGDYELARELAARASTAIESARRMKKARAAVEAREKILSVVSHDLRNPLSAATISLESLLRHLPPEEQGERRGGRTHVDAAVRALRRMDRLVGDLVDFSSIEAGRLALDVGVVDLPALVAQLVENEAPAASARGVVLRADVDLALDAGLEAFLDAGTAAELEAGRIAGDPARLSQVLTNLVGNAVQFTPRGGSVIIRARADVDAVTIDVVDTGCGIDPLALGALFKPYVQARKNGRSGRGLGLYIARAIVRAHGGELTVESSDPQRGSTFRVRLPVVAPPAARAPATHGGALATFRAKRARA